jgi:hypothetical protein
MQPAYLSRKLEVPKGGGCCRIIRSWSAIAVYLHYGNLPIVLAGGRTDALDASMCAIRSKRRSRIGYSLYWTGLECRPSHSGYTTEEFNRPRSGLNVDSQIVSRKVQPDLHMRKRPTTAPGAAPGYFPLFGALSLAMRLMPVSPTYMLPCLSNEK